MRRLTSLCLPLLLAAAVHAADAAAYYRIYRVKQLPR